MAIPQRPKEAAFSNVSTIAGKSFAAIGSFSKT